MKIKNYVTQSYPDYEHSWLIEDNPRTEAIPACGLVAIRDDDGTVRFYDDEYPASVFIHENVDEKYRV
jgi:hypothetical protein